MILLVGLKHDPVIRYLHDELKLSGLEYAFIDQQCLGGHVLLKSDCIYSQQEQWEIKHEQIQAVINRLVGSPTKPSSSHIEHLELLIHYLDNIYPNVLNRPSSGLSNNSKPLQLSMLGLSNCQAPNSIVCAGLQPPERANMIFKSISSVRSIVKTVSDVTKTVKEPVIFQDMCAGKNIRVHCLNQKYVATEIDSVEIDYRYAKQQKMKQIKIPEAIKQECININNHLGLIFSGIDFIKSGDTWTLLEANPAPGYSFYENTMPDKPISRMIINYLKELI